MAIVTLAQLKSYFNKGDKPTEAQFIDTIDTLSSGSFAYKSYIALLTQAGTNAPTAVVLENTLGGTVVWTRSNTGNYTGTLVGAFLQTKTILMIQKQFQTFNGNQIEFAIGRNGNDSIYILSTNTATSTNADSLLSSTGIEIRIYL